MFLIRFILGKIILAFDALFVVKKDPIVLDRKPEKQKQFDELCRSYKLYQFTGCYFCVKVRRAIRRMGLNIEFRACEDGPFREELIREGGQLQVPCLRIDDHGTIRWLYESEDIIAFLAKKFMNA